MIGRLRMVSVGAVCLALVAFVPGALAGTPVPPGQHPIFGDVPQAPALVQDEALPAVPLNPYVPPACTGVFSDVTCPSGFAVNWIEQFYSDGITAGCGTNPLRYCPDSPVKRSEMAVFVEKAMRGTGTWSPGDLGKGNTGLGSVSLLDLTTGQANTGLGYGSLEFNTTAWDNTAVGSNSLPANTSASGNTALGSTALFGQSYDPGYTWFSYNTAVGIMALNGNQPTSTTNGVNNTAVGAISLAGNVTGADNTALGFKAGYRGGEVIVGYGGSNVALVSSGTGSFNTFIGITGSTAQVSNCTTVGMDAYCDSDNEVRLGNYYVTSIGGKVGFSALSDARAKTDVRDLDLGLEFVLALHPVSYHLKGGNGRTDMGFVAQDIEALLGDEFNVLGIGGDKDRTLSLRHTDLMAPMVKAIQEQQATIEKQKAQITDQSKTIQGQQVQIEALKTALAERDSALERRLAALEQRKQ